LRRSAGVSHGTVSLGTEPLLQCIEYKPGCGQLFVGGSDIKLSLLAIGALGTACNALICKGYEMLYQRF